VSNKARRGDHFFGRRQRQSVAKDERPQQEEEIPNPMKPEEWVCWLELQRELEFAQIQDLKTQARRFLMRSIVRV
jgi:hypothetical protein